MASLTWTGIVGSWFDPNNWVPQQVPQSQDAVTIPSGTAIITSATIENELITLGGLNGSLPSLSVTSTTISSDHLIVTGGDPTLPVNATLLSYGNTSFEGFLSVEAFGGSLTIDARSDGNSADFTFAESDGGTLALVTQESILSFTGQQINNTSIIQVEGTINIAEGVSFIGDGTIELDAGGLLSVEGSVGPDQKIYFDDGQGTLRIADASAFHGVVGLTQYGGDRIALTEVLAQSASYREGVLTLYAGPNQTGSEVAHLRVILINSESLIPLPPEQQTLTEADFLLSTGPEGGTLITYTPQGPTYLEASLPVAVVAPTNTLVSLDTILAQSFGTATLGYYSMELIPPPSDLNPVTKYWGQPPDGSPVAPAWIVNGQEITTPRFVTADDEVQLRIGNNISDPAQIQVQVTPVATGEDAEFITYNVWTVDPAVAERIQSSGFEPGSALPSSIVASAEAYAAVFPGVQNSNLCNWIADDVAAAAGATMPLPNAQLDPTLNLEGGFWRVVYRGSDSPTPVQNWSERVEPGDVVRMEWLAGSGHTTTVLAVNSDGTIQVYDNVGHTIHIHDAKYWNSTDPAGITIYRLDANRQYLIEGTKLGEVIHGSVYNDLIRPGGGADIITAGPGFNEIEDTTAHLNGIAITDFDVGDRLDFTDLNPAQATVAYDKKAGALHVLLDGIKVAAVAMPRPEGGEYFIVTPDLSGGSFVELASTNASVSEYVHDLLANPEHGGIGSLVSAFAKSMHGTHQGHDDLLV